LGLQAKDTPQKFCGTEIGANLPELCQRFEILVQMLNKPKNIGSYKVLMERHIRCNSLIFMTSTDL
jgi:hypothetical protein